MFRNFIFPIGRNYLFYSLFYQQFFKFKVMKKKQIKLAVLINFFSTPIVFIRSTHSTRNW